MLVRVASSDVELTARVAGRPGHRAQGREHDGDQEEWQAA